MKKDRHLESRKRLLQIVESIGLIEKFIEGQDLSDFCQDDKLNNAIMMQFVIIGECIKNTEKEKLDKYNYPWQAALSFRNLIAHEYFNVHLPAVWEIIKTDLPYLKEMITTILKKEF